MTDEPFSTPRLKIPEEAARHRDHVWTLTKENDLSVRAELLSHGAGGWELQIFTDGELFYGCRWDLREGALHHARATRRGLLIDGWRDAAE
jgi:hypothetical protein